MTRWSALAAVLLLAGVAAAADGPWRPFAPDLSDALRLDAPWTTVRDGAYGSALVLLHEPGAGPLHDFRRDGLPLGTGHLWSDGPWSVSMAGATPSVVSTGGVGFRSAGGAVAFRSFEADTSGAVLDSRFFKGGEESYLRRLSYRTPKAPWILGFDFDEQILHDFDSPQIIDPSETAPPYPGVAGDNRFAAADDWEAKGRIARTTLWRIQPDGDRLRLSYERLRSHAVELPAFDLLRREQWGDRMQFGWSGRVAGGDLDVGAALNGSDLLLERTSRALSGNEFRTITSARQSLRGDWRRTDGALSATFEASAWRVSELGDAVWEMGDVPVYRESREEADGRVARSWLWGGRALELAGGFGWQRMSGVHPRLEAEVEDGERRWRLTLGYGGRAPRSDELGTAWTTATPLQTVRMLPNRDLDFERTARAELVWNGHRMGLDLQAVGTARSTRDGIGWLAQGSAVVSSEGVIADRTESWGAWANGVDMDAWTAGLRASRTMDLAGRLTMAVRYDARGWNVDAAPGTPLPVFLPPERSAAVEARWLHAFFKGDGILELGWDVEHRGEATDPWLPGTADRIPALTLHHALVMFRLVGTDIGLSFRNVFDNQSALSSGTLAVVKDDGFGATSGRDMRWRLQWTLRH